MLDPKNPEKYFDASIKLRKDFKKQRKEIMERAIQNYVDTPAFLEQIHQQQINLVKSQKGIHTGLISISREWNYSKFREQLQTQYQLSMTFFESNENIIKEISRKLLGLTQMISKSPFDS